jgi:hypothetical protein
MLSTGAEIHDVAGRYDRMPTRFLDGVGDANEGLFIGTVQGNQGASGCETPGDRRAD